MGRRLLYLTVLAMAAMLVFAPAALAQERLNCTDLLPGTAEEIQNKAQARLDQNPSGPAQNLDADGDGIACEYTFSVQSGTEFEDGSGFISGAGAAPSAEGAGGDQYGNGGTNGDQDGNGGDTGGGGNTGGGEVSGGTLPDTSGAPLFALSAGALLVGGGLLARRITR